MKHYPALLGASLILSSVCTQAGATDQVMRVALLSSTAQSTLYKWNDSEGRVYYSDRPPVGTARDYEVTPTSAKGGMVQVGAKIVPDYLPLPIPPKDAVTASHKPKADLTANLVWLEKAR